MARDINKLKDRLHAVKGLDSASAYNAQDEDERKKKQAAQLKSDAQINAARQAGEQARLAAIEKNKKILRENREANVQAQKQATAKSNANRAVSPGIEDTISRKQQLTDAMVQLRDWGSGKGDKWQSNNDFQTAYNAYENAMSWAEQSEAAGDIDAAKYMREAASYLAKWGNIAGTELTKLTDQYGSFENAEAYRNGDRSGYREYLNRDKSWKEIDSHIKELEKTIESTSDLKRRSEYMEELDWYNNYARNNYTEAAETELDLLRRKQDTLQNALAQSELNNSPLNGTPVDDDEKSEILKRFDEDIEAAKAANMDPWYISALEKARESFVADASPVSYEQNWQDIDRYDELSGRIGGLNDQIASAEQSLEMAKTADWERNNRIKYAALEQEMNAANWYFDNYDYENFKELVASEKNSAAMQGMPDIYTVDVRDQYTKEEASIYMYLREKGRVEEADAFANYMQSTAAGRRNQQIGQRLAEEDIGIVGRTIGAVAANPGKIANTIDINLQKLGNVLGDEYIPIDYETTGNFGVASNVNREIATQELAALGTLNDALGVEIPYIGSYTLGDLYGTGVDYLNSAMNVALFGTGAAGTALAAEKFSDEYRAAKERGGTDDQAFNYAWGSSIAEGVGEQIVLDRYLGFLTKLGRNPGKAAAIMAGIISVAEGGVQEAATTVMENAVDKWTMGENSEFNIAVRRYEAMGYEHGTAEQMAIDEMNREILKSGIMGALGQGAPVAGGYAAQGISKAAGSVQTAIDDSARGRQIQKMDNAQQMAQLMGEVTGETVTPEKSKRKLGKQQREFIENAGEYVSGADEATRDIVRGKVYDVANASAEALDGTSQAAKVKAGKRSAAMKTSDTGASVGGESVTVQGFVKTAEKGSDAKLNIKKADGTLAEANMEDVTFDSKTAEVYSYAADMATPELANDFRMRIQPDQMGSIERVANGYSQAYDMARAGFKEASVRASSLTGALTDEQVSAAYKLGAEARKSAQIAAITKAAERAKANMGNAWKGGTARFDDSVVVDALDDTQKAQIDVASVFTGSMGVNVVFFESKADETGRFTRENGSYNRRTNTIYIDVNAGRYYKGDSPSKTALLRTLSHEVTHAVQRNSPEIYSELRDTVTDILGDAKGVTIEDLIDRKMAADSSLIDRDAAMDELVADACERMIEDSDAAQRLAEAHPEAAKTIFQKVGELLKKIGDAIKAAFKGRQLSTEAQLVMKDVERYQKMVDLWTKGVMQTAEVSGREHVGARVSEMETVAITEETAAEGEEVTSGEAVGLFDEAARTAEVHIDNRTWENDDVQFQARDYSYAELTAKPDMIVTQLHNDDIDRETAGKDGIENVKKYAERYDANGAPLMYVPDLGKFVTVGRKALEHGLGRNASAQGRVIAQIGDILHNAIVVNEAIPKKTGVRNTWLLLGTAQTVDNAIVYVRFVVNQSTGHVDEISAMYSALGKEHKKTTGRSFAPQASANSIGLPTDLTISIADLLAGVNGIFDDVISADVARHLGIARSKSEFSGRLLYQTRDPHAVSDREILANALDNAAQTDDERIRLAAYKEGLAKLNSYQVVLDENKAVIGQLAFKKGRTSEENDRLTRAKNRVKMINEKLDEADRALLKLEAMDPIKAIITREGKKVRDERNAVMRERISDMKQTHENAATRKSIGRKVKRLNDMLINATDQRHIPEEFKSAVKDMLELFTNDTSVFDKDRLERVRTAYAAIEASKTDAASMYDDDIAYEIELLATTIGGRRLAKLNANELQMVRNILDHFAKMVKDANNVFLDGRRASIDALSFEVEEQTSGKQHMENRLTEAKFRKWLTEGQIIPPYFFKNLGGAMGRLGDAILSAEGQYGIEVNAARSRIQELLKKYNHKKWANIKNDTLNLTTESGDTITLTREQALGLYATHKREVTNKDQNAHHLSEAGIVFRKQVKDLKLFKKTFRNSNAVPISGKDMETVMDWLTKEQMQYADAMVEYISTEMAVLGNETSMQLHGYRKFNEGFYYPYKVASDFLKSDFSKTEDALIKNMGFTKRTQRGASNPLVVTDFTETVADHVNRMLLYHNFAVPQDSFMRVYDHHISKSKTVKSALDTAYGNRIGSYINQFMKDMYGGVVRDNTEDIANKWLGKFKKAKVMASLSVAVQQPSSIGRAFALVNVKYFRPVHAKGAFDEAMQYAGTAVIKSIGRFDTNTGSNVVDWMTREGFDGVMDFVDTAGGFLPEQMDMISWGTIWDAVKREQADKTGLDIDSEELKKIAGKRFNEVIRFTQVYDSTLVRSQTMRSKSVWTKMATSFMSEATVTYNMVYDALQNITKEPRKATATFAAVAGSIIANALLKSIVTAARDDDDEEATYKELYIKNFMADLINGFAPMTYVPLASDIWSIAQGFTVERTDLEVFNLAKEFVDIMQNENAGTEKKLRTAASFISMVSGIPISNVWREVDAIKNTITAVQNTERPAWFETAIKRGLSDGVILSYFFDDSKAANVDKLYKEARTGSKDAAETREHLILYNNVKDDKAVDSLLRTRIKDGFTAGEIGADEAIEMLTGYAGMKQEDASDKVLEWQYAIDNDGSSYSDMRERYLEGEISYDDAVSDRMQYGGVESDKAKATVDKWEFERLNGYAYEDLREEHADGNVSSAEAMEIMQDYGGKDENEAYWEVTEWDYGDGWDGKGTLLNDAFAAGSDAQVRSRMQELAGHSDWQKPGNELASYVTDYYKPIYEAAPAAQKDALRQTILGYLKMAYEAVGEEYYGDDYALRYRNWLKK